MDNRITSAAIKNFKSIKELELKDCRRVNLFIGKPNTGKSNILEALSMFCGPMSFVDQAFLSPFIRFNLYNDLFSGNDIKNPIYVRTNLNTLRLRWHFADAFEFVIDTPDEEVIQSLPQDGRLQEIQSIFNQELSKYGTKHPNKSRSLFFKVLSSDKNSDANKGYNENYISPIRKYYFQKGVKHGNPFSIFLVAPNGNNLPAVLYQQPDLLEFLGQMIHEEYGLSLSIVQAKNQILLQQSKGYFSSTVEFDLISDTLQRLMFYTAAIASNSESILLLEEPEVHSFPPFLSIIADRIARDEKNQYFITTHSPYLLNTILANINKEDVAVNIVDYIDFQTYIRRITEEEISEVLSYGPGGSAMDVFFNLEKFPMNG